MAALSKQLGAVELYWSKHNHFAIFVRLAKPLIPIQFAFEQTG